MKKMFSLLLAAVIIASMAGCNASSDTSDVTGTTVAPNNSNSGSGDKKVVKMAVSGSAQEMAIREETANLYMEKNKDVAIEWIDIGNERVQKTLTLISAGEAPDILYLNEYVYSFAAKNVLLPLDDLIAKDNYDLSVFHQSLLEPLKYDGKLYGLPQEVSPFVVYYNKDMFKTANIPLPTDTWTIDEFYDAAKKLTNPAEKVYGYRHPAGWLDQATGWFSRAGVEFDISGSEVKGLDTPEALKTLNFLNNLVLVDKLSPDPADAQAMGKGFDAMFRNQKVAMESAGLWMLPTYKSDPLPFEWDVVRMPKDKDQRTKVGILNWSISKDSKNVDLAWDVLKFFEGPEGMKIVAESNMALPATSEAAANQIVLDTKFPENVKAFVDSAPETDLLDQKSVFRNEVGTAFNAELDLMLLGQQTPEETQKALIEKINEILAS